MKFIELVNRIGRRAGYRGARLSLCVIINFFALCCLVYCISLPPVISAPQVRFLPHDSKLNDYSERILRIAKSFENKGGVIQLDCQKIYYIGKSINIAVYPGTTIRGCLPDMDDPGGFPAYQGDLNSLGGISRAATATILVGRDSGLENVILRQSDMPVTAKTAAFFAGTAIASASGGAGRASILHNVLVLGAETCFDDSAGGGRVRIDGLYCDGTNGEIIGPSYDTSVITNVHNWPFATAGADPKLRSGVGLAVRGASDDTVFGTIFDFGHRIGFLFDSNLHGNFHVEHLWADNNSEACVRFAGGRGINVASLTAYTCGIAIDVEEGAEVQISQAFLVASRQECVRDDGTLSFALLHLEECHGGGIRVATPQSVLSVGFLQVLNLAGPWTIDVPPGFTSDHVGIGKFFTNAPPGSSLYAGQGPVDPILQAAPTLDLPPSGDAVRLDGRGVVARLRGGWGGRTLTITTAGREAAIAAGGNVALANGVAFGGRLGAVLSLRYDATNGLWREVSRSAP